MHPETQGETYFLRIGGQIFGPYSHASILHYLDEGRVVPSALIATRPDGDFRAIAQFVTFSPKVREIQDRKGFGRRTLHGENGTDGAGAEGHDSELANVVIVTDIQSAAALDFETRLQALGRAARIFGSVFVLRTHHSAAQLRHSLGQMLSRGDRFFLVDATRERLAWFNLGPEVDAHLRKIWSQPLDTPRPS